MTTYHAHPSTNGVRLTTPAGALVLEVAEMAFAQQQMKLVSGYQTGSTPVLAYEVVAVRWPASAWREKAAEIRGQVAQLQAAFDRLTARGPLYYTEPAVGGAYRRQRNKQLNESHQTDLHQLRSVIELSERTLSCLDYSL